MKRMEVDEKTLRWKIRIRANASPSPYVKFLEVIELVIEKLFGRGSR